jgi:hypothetical protein
MASRFNHYTVPRGYHSDLEYRELMDTLLQLEEKHARHVRCTVQRKCGYEVIASTTRLSEYPRTAAVLGQVTLFYPFTDKFESGGGDPDAEPDPMECEDAEPTRPDDEPIPYEGLGHFYPVGGGESTHYEDLEPGEPIDDIAHLQLRRCTCGVFLAPGPHPLEGPTPYVERA